MKRNEYPGAKAGVILGVLVAMVAWADAVSQEVATDNRPPGQKREKVPVDLSRTIAADELQQDLQQFRTILKREWILANLNDANFDGAIDEIERDAGSGVTLAELTMRLQRVLAMGVDGHAHMANYPGALDSVKGVYQDFVIDLCGERYIAYRVVASAGKVNPGRKYRFRLLRDGYPYITAIDGLPIDAWVRAADRYVPRGPGLARRWNCMVYLQYLPFFRRELKLPESPRVRVRLASADGRAEIDVDAPTGKDAQFHFHASKPDWEIIGDRIGYLNLRNSAGRVQTTVMETMPRLRTTKGLVLDLRGNPGGHGSGLLQIVASYLVPTAEPRVVVGQVVRWKDARKIDWMLGTPLDLEGLNDEAQAGVRGLSDPGRKLLEEFLARVKPKWQPPAHRATVNEGVMLVRPEAERAIFPYSSPLFPTDTYYYDQAVVVLYDHRCFSAAELLLASLRQLPNVTLVGTPNTAAGGGAPASFTLDNSGLTFFVASTAFVRADGRLIDGIGIEPDVRVEPDVDYYLGTADRMLDNAIKVLNEKIAARSAGR